MATPPPETIMSIPATLALPALSKIQDCADFSKTVTPFLPQLYDLPSRVVQSGGSLQALRQLYVETNPLISALAASLVLSVFFFIVAEVNRNWSQVDRAWSVVPNLYVAHFALWARLAGAPGNRVEFLLSATTIWSARLTYNYTRRGGYNKGSEDYRWPILREHIPPWAFFLFSVTFIAAIQSVLLFAFSAVPTYVILLTSFFEPDVMTADWVYCGAMLGLVLVEFISDGQQWAYQEAKRQYLQQAKVPAGFKQADLDRGFNTTGLWAYSRHPNCAAEQLVWFVLYQWSCYASSVMVSYAFAGFASLMALFQGSTWFTEQISSSKYPEYKDYQAQIAMFMPASLVAFKPKEPEATSTGEKAKKQGSKKA